MSFEACSFSGNRWEVQSGLNLSSLFLISPTVFLLLLLSFMTIQCPVLSALITFPFFFFYLADFAQVTFNRFHLTSLSGNGFANLLILWCNSLLPHVLLLSGGSSCRWLMQKKPVVELNWIQISLCPAKTFTSLITKIVSVSSVVTFYCRNLENAFSRNVPLVQICPLLWRKGWWSSTRHIRQKRCQTEHPCFSIVWWDVWYHNAFILRPTFQFRGVGR